MNLIRTRTQAPVTRRGSEAAKLIEQDLEAYIEALRNCLKPATLTYLIANLRRPLSFEIDMADEIKQLRDEVRHQEDEICRLEEVIDAYKAEKGDE